MRFGDGAEDHDGDSGGPVTVPFALTKHDDGSGVVRIVISGELDADVSAALTTIIGNAAEQDGVAELIVDLERVSFLAATGASALLECRAQAARRGCSCRVVNAYGVTYRMLRAIGVADVLEDDFSDPAGAVPGAHPRLAEQVDAVKSRVTRLRRDSDQLRSA